jgi:Tfp pilus assembly protein PilF
MSPPKLGGAPPVRYSVHTDAATVFKFLSGTFFQMPKPVQVIAYFVFLFLFVYLVLNPILGITYYEGTVVTLGFDERQNPYEARAAGTTVTRGTTVVTNQLGEFTLGVRVPYIPLTSVELLFTPPGAKTGEEVPIPMPKPFLSLFSPNLRKVYYVPGSTVTDPSGLYVRHYFLDAKRARQARDSSVRHAYATQPPRVVPFRGAGENFGLSLEVHAAAPNPTGRAYMLRLRQLAVAGIKSAIEVYFEIRVDGQLLHLDTLPSADSSELRDLTVLAESPARFDALYIPVSEDAHHVDISILERKSFYQRDTRVGTVGFDFTPDKIGKVVPLSSANLELDVELLPPVTVACATVPGKQRNYIATFGLDLASDSLEDVDKVQYDVPGFEHSSVAFPEIGPFDFYAHTISIFAAQLVTAKIDFRGGSTLNLATLCTPATRHAKSPVEHYLLARAYWAAGDLQAALQEVNKALQADQKFAAAISLSGDVLAAQGDYRGAMAEYLRAMTLAPDSADVLNSYAWMVTDTILHPRPSELLNAEKMAERAVELSPHADYLDTLGWVEFKLGKNEKALQALGRASLLQGAIDRNSTAWQEISYHVAVVNKALGNNAEATRRFQDVVDYGMKFPALSNNRYVQEAKDQIARRLPPA